MTIEKTIHGAYIMRADIDGQVFKRMYMFFSKREAKRLFLRELKQATK